MNLIENAIDSLQHAIQHYCDRKPNDIKYTILHFSHCVELFLKSRLEKDHFSLIYSKPEEAKNKNSKTVDMITCIARLKTVNVAFTKEEINDLEYIKKIRNSIEHHVFEIDQAETELYVGRALRFLEKYLNDELDINLREIVPFDQLKDATEYLYSYEERVKLAISEMNSELPMNKDKFEYDVTDCPECGEATIVVPDPKRDDGLCKCYNCEKISEMEKCIRCSQPFVVDELTNMDMCDECWFIVINKDE